VGIFRPVGGQIFVTLISGFRRDVEICALLEYYEASCGLLTLQDGTDTLSRNVSKQLPHDVAYYPKTAQISTNK
jgi:hypothetical protein